MIDIVTDGKLAEFGKMLGYDLILADLIIVSSANKNVKPKALVQARDDAFNRYIIEKSKAIGIFNPEYVHTKDHTHYRRSGLDQVICRAAAKKGKIIVTSLANFQKAENKLLILGRIAQNIRLCRKYKVEYVIASFAKDKFEMKGAHEIKCLMESLTKH